MSRRFLPVAAVAAALFLLSGCGGTKYHPVTGTVTLDGVTVENANVTFVTDDGKKSYAGLTDASGKYTITTGDKPGLPAGAYKVTVTKPKKMEGGDMTPGSADYMKSMAKMAKETASKDPTAKGGFQLPGAAMTGGSPMPKGDLPQLYAAPSTSPFSATIPASGPVDFALTGEAKKK